MYSVKSPLIFAFFLLYFSSSDGETEVSLKVHMATIANIDPSKYTVHFTYKGALFGCAGGIIGERKLISSVGCFADRATGFVPDTKLLKAVIGSVEIQVAQVLIPKIPPGEKFVPNNFALIALEEDINLEKNGLTKLHSPVHEIQVNSSAVVSKGGGGEILTIVDPENCPRDEMNYFPESHLCIELPDSSEGCLLEDGAPLVVQGDDGVNYIIGVRVDCYVNLQYAEFAKTNFREE